MQGVSTQHGATFVTLSSPSCSQAVPNFEAGWEDEVSGFVGNVCDEQATSSDFLTGLADALSAERKAIMAEMEKRHEALLLKLGSQPIFTVENDQVCDTSEEPCEVHDVHCSDGFTFTQSDKVKTDTVLKKGATIRCAMTEGEVLRMECEGATGLQYIRLRLRAFIYGGYFETCIVILIFLNSFTMVAEVQYRSLRIAQDLYSEGVLPEIHFEYTDVSPEMLEFLYFAELCFGAVFTTEVILKSGLDLKRFVRSAWNAFDTLIVSFWVLSLFETGFGLNPMVLRLIRLGKVLRVVRLVKTLEAFSVLHVLFGCLKKSWTVFLWSFLLVLGITTFGALTFNACMESFIQDASNPPDARQLIFERFGSFSRAMLSMFEVILGNFFPVAGVLRERVSEWYVLLLMIYYSVASFCIVQVIRGVFLRETMKVASWEDDLMIMEQDVVQKKHLADMDRFFKEADASGDGILSYEEFSSLLADPRVRSWLGARGVDASQAQLVFQLLDDDEDRCLSAQELSRGVKRLKGHARSMDVMVIDRICRDIERSISKLCSRDDASISQKRTRQTQGINVA